MGCTCSAEAKERTEPHKQKENNQNIQNIQVASKNKENLKTEDLTIKQEPLTFDKKLCESIESSLPRRTKTNLQSLKDLIKQKTNNISQTEKAFVVFLWECYNIDYDAQGYFSGSKVDCTPNGVFQNGKTVCSGYSRLYKEITTYIGLEVECVTCYAKGVGYEPGQKFNGTNHEYNAIKLNQNWYPIDSTWGAGHIEGKEFVRAYNEFYFLANPELLIKTHFPENEKWQLTKKKYTLEDFSSWPKVDSNFYRFGFNKFFPEEGSINLQNKNTQKFIIYGQNMKKKRTNCNIYLLEGNCYNQKLNLTLINYYEDRFDIDCIFNKKGKYKVTLFGNDNITDTKTTSIMEYTVNVENDAKNELNFPHTYASSHEINLIEPLYNKLKSGEKVKFKIKSDLDTIIIIDGQWNYLKKNEEGYFESEIQITTSPGNNVIIAKKKGDNSCTYLITYDII